MKRLFFFLFLCFVLVPAICLALTKEKKKDLKPTKKYPIEIFFGGHGRPSYSDVSGFPMAARNIPVHRDDGYLSHNPCSIEPLPDTTLSLPDFGGLDLSIFFTPKTAFGLGVIISLPSSSSGGVDSPERYQQNQYCDADRGYGTSLRWYEISGGGCQMTLAGYLATPWQHIYKAANLRLKTGGIYDMTGFKLYSKMGYDRWGSDEHWKDFTLARIREHRAFVAMELGLVMANEKDPNKNEGTAYLQAMYFYPFYDFQQSDEAPDLSFRQGEDCHFAFAIGFSY